MIVDLAVIGAATLILLAAAVPVVAWDVRDRWRRSGQQLEALIDATREPPVPAAACCVCGQPGPVYENYCGMWFCWPCADGVPPVDWEAREREVNQ